MKKGWKIFLGICGGVMALGLVLTLTGKAMGTDFSSLENNIRERITYEHLEREGIWNLFEHEDDDDCYDDSEFYDDYDDYDGDENRQWNYDWDGESVQESESTVSGQEYKGIQSVDMSIGAGEVIVEAYDGTSVMLDSSRVKDVQKLTVHTDEEELEIEWRTKTGVVTSSAGTLIIYVPKSGIAEMSAKVGAGTLALNGVVVGELDIDLGAGKAKIAADILREADFECGAGQMDVSLPGIESDYNYSLRCGIGKIQVGSKAYDGLANRTRVNNNAGKNIDIDCGVGEVAVAFQ